MSIISIHMYFIYDLGQTKPRGGVNTLPNKMKPFKTKPNLDGQQVPVILWYLLSSRVHPAKLFQKAHIWHLNIPFKVVFLNHLFSIVFKQFKVEMFYSGQERIFCISSGSISPYNGFNWDVVIFQPDLKRLKLDFKSWK